MEEVLPKGWVNGNISNFVCKDGLFKDGDWIESKDQDVNGDVRLIQLADIGVNEFRDKSNRFLNSSKASELKCTLLKEDDVLIARMPDPIGRSCVFPLSGKFVTVVDVAIVRLKENVFNPSLFSYFINSPEIQKQISNLASGSTRQRISRKNLDTITIPLPPLLEQKRIVAKLDNLFAQHELMQKALERIPQLLKEFRQQVLTQAVTGKLTERWREDNFLKKIEIENLIEKAEYNLLDFSNIPKSWIITALGNYAVCSRGKFTPRPRNDPKYFGGKYPFMQIGDLPREGGITYSYSKTLNELGKNVSKCFEKNTVVIAIVGATIGNTGILNEKMYFPDSLIGINTQSIESNKFIEYFLRVCKYDIREISYSSGGQPNINNETIKNLEIAIPSLQEQEEIVRILESLFAKADAIEVNYQKLKAKIASLPQAILHKAFKGELTVQLPTDGDATDLLKEIKVLKKELKTNRQ